MSYTVGRGSQAWAGFALADQPLTHKDPSSFLTVKAFGMKQDVKFNPIPVLTPGMQEPINYRYEGEHSVAGNVQTPFYPEQALALLKAVFGASVDSTVTTGVYNHKLTGQDTVPAVPLSFTLYEDLSCMNLVGCYPTGMEIDIEKGNPVQLTVPIIGMHGFDQKGTAGTSTGQNAITFPLTLVVGVSDDIKLTIDGGTITEVNIPAAVYANGAAIAAAINTAIASTVGMVDTYNRPIVACYVTSADKLVFYSGSKGITSTVVWAAGTHSASTLLGMGTPVKVDGVAANSKPSESSIQPFIATRATMTLAGIEIPGVEKVKITVKNGLGLQDVIGYFFKNQPVLTGRRSVTGTMELAFTDTTWLTKHLANTTFALKATLLTAVQIGATAYYYQAVIWLNSCKATKTPIPNVTGTGVIKQTIEFQAFSDVTYQDIEIDVQNSQATVV